MLERRIRPSHLTRTNTVPTLDIRHLGVRYATKTGTVDALADVNLEMRDGDFVVAIGASGCGKTTLLYCIAGLPAADRRHDRARRATGRRSRRRPRRRVPEARADALAQRHRQRGVRLAHARRRRDDAAAQSRWTSCSSSGSRSSPERAIYELSGGMQQRVGIARALASDPGADADGRAARRARRVHARSDPGDSSSTSGTRRARCAFFITHSVEEALFLATHLVVMTPRPGQASRTSTGSTSAGASSRPATRAPSSRRRISSACARKCSR